MKDNVKTCSPGGNKALVVLFMMLLPNAYRQNKNN